MDSSDYEARLRELARMLTEIRARIHALEIRVAAAEQSLDQRWVHAR
jgi:multidrug resistance efflux pump